MERKKFLFPLINAVFFIEWANTKLNQFEKFFLDGLKKVFGLNFLEGIKGNVNMLLEIDINFCSMDDFWSNILKNVKLMACFEISYFGFVDSAVVFDA